MKETTPGDRNFLKLYVQLTTAALVSGILLASIIIIQHSAIMGEISKFELRAQEDRNKMLDRVTEIEYQLNISHPQIDTVKELEKQKLKS